MEPNDSKTQPSPDECTPDFSPPASLTMPLWRSLYIGLRERLFPEKLPGLHLTSQPVNLGMPIGERLRLPWFRTVFTNIGDVITPEELPLLELEARPVDTGELISDQVQHGWWTSLLRNLADNVAPEHMPAIELSSTPVKPDMASAELMAPRWSNLLTTPKVFLPDQQPEPMLLQASAPALESVPFEPPVALPKESEFLWSMVNQLRRNVHRAHIRELIWLIVAGAEIVFLVVYHIVQK
jgi:hypothetical protein